MEQSKHTAEQGPYSECQNTGSNLATGLAKSLGHPKSPDTAPTLVVEPLSPGFAPTTWF